MFFDFIAAAPQMGDENGLARFLLFYDFLSARF